MSRGLGGAATTAVQGEVVTRTSAVELLFASGAVRLNGSLAPLVIGGATFDGVGLLGGITQVSEVAEMQSAGITVSIAGVPRDVVSLAMAEPYQGRQATVWEVLLDPDTGGVIEAVVIFRGRMDQMNLRLGETAAVEVTLEDRLTDMDRPALSRYTPEDQARAYPADRGFDFVSATVEKDIVWPSRTWRSS
jgi:hypothetical protein